MIYVASDEKPKIKTALKNKKTSVQFEHLELGDYIVGKYIIERKEINDLMTSAISGRLFHQLSNINKFCTDHGFQGILLVEGWKLNNKTIKLLKITNPTELMVNAMDFFKVLPVKTNSMDETIQWLVQLEKAVKGENVAIKSVRGFKRKKSDLDKKLFFLQGLPSVGESRSKTILKKYDTIFDYFKHIVENEENSVIYNILM